MCFLSFETLLGSLQEGCETGLTFVCPRRGRLWDLFFVGIGVSQLLPLEFVCANMGSKTIGIILLEDKADIRCMIYVIWIDIARFNIPTEFTPRIQSYDHFASRHSILACQMT